MQASDYTTWRQFFREASIPDEYASSYAAIFTDNRMRLDMLADLDRALLNDMGIVAVGDCLSILKHAKATYPKIQTKKKDEHPPPASLSLSVESISSNESPKPPRIAKRIVDRLISDTDFKSTGSTVTPNHNYTNSTLSADLLTRLNFNPSSSTPVASSTSPVKQPIVRFNKESLEPSKVIVSSTTGDTDDSQSPQKIISLKRKLHDDVKSNRQPESVVVEASRSTNKASNSIFSGISITTDSKSKVVKLATSSSNSRIDTTSSDNDKKHSVFKRIKSSNVTNDKPVQFHSSHSTSSLSNTTQTNHVGSKVVISLNKNKSQVDLLANNKRVKSIKDRLSFN